MIPRKKASRVSPSKPIMTDMKRFAPATKRQNPHPQTNFAQTAKLSANSFFFCHTGVLSKKWVTPSVLEEGVVVWGEIGAS
jgi:hypothetical protein